MDHIGGISRGLAEKHRVGCPNDCPGACGGHAATREGFAPSRQGSRHAGGRGPRSRLVFALLAVFAGFSGAHNFYARQWMTGMLQLLLSVATSLMSFGIIASWLWAIVEAVVVRRDGNGNDMI